MNPNPDQLVLFQLYRREDESGVSGEGTVAFGVKFPEPNGRVVLGWVTDFNSVAVYDSMDDMKDIHGHGGKTSIVQMDAIDCGHA
jgi:hypothetical protein